MNSIRDIKSDRHDLTDYVIHFTRKSPGLSSFDVLKKVVKDGYLKAGWSERGKRKTIFGDKPAICFTETPLCGFLDYIKKRGNKYLIDEYGIFIKKKDLFKIGGRPVIYGTTLEPEESERGGNFYIKGFSDEEQYRYILTSIDEKNDWVHEREWRWANWKGLSTLENGLPLWRVGQIEPFANCDFRYAPLGIIVKTNDERIILERILTDYYDKEHQRLLSSIEDFDDKEFLRKTIQSTKIIVIENIAPEVLKTARIEDLMHEKEHFTMNEILTKKYNVKFL